MNDPDSWLLTLDENGCWNGNCNEYILIDSDSTSYTLGSSPKPPLVQSNLYPNPSTGTVFFEFEDFFEKKLLIYDISGKKVMEQDLYAIKSFVNLNSMPNSVYILNVINKKGQLVSNKKVIIQH